MSLYHIYEVLEVTHLEYHLHTVEADSEEAALELALTREPSPSWDCDLVHTSDDSVTAEGQFIILASENTHAVPLDPDGPLQPGTPWSDAMGDLH